MRIAWRAVRAFAARQKNDGVIGLRHTIATFLAIRLADTFASASPLIVELRRTPPRSARLSGAGRMTISAFLRLDVFAEAGRRASKMNRKSNKKYGRPYQGRPNLPSVPSSHRGKRGGEHLCTFGCCGSLRSPRRRFAPKRLERKEKRKISDRPDNLYI